MFIARRKTHATFYSIIQSFVDHLPSHMNKLVSLQCLVNGFLLILFFAAAAIQDFGCLSCMCYICELPDGQSTMTHCDIEMCVCAYGVRFVIAKKCLLKIEMNRQWTLDKYYYTLHI